MKKSSSLLVSFLMPVMTAAAVTALACAGGEMPSTGGGTGATTGGSGATTGGTGGRGFGSHRGSVVFRHWRAVDLVR